MANSDFVIVILGAGKGTRLKSSLAKVLHRAGGRSLVEHVVRACQPLKAREIIAVVGHQAEDVTAALVPLGAKTALQKPQRGTGHAMLVARRAIPSRAKYVIVLPGAAPLIRTDTLAALARSHRETGAAATILSAEIDNPAGYGRIVRNDDGSVAAIVEDSALNDDQRAIREINSSIYCFTLGKLWPETSGHHGCGRDHRDAGNGLDRSGSHRRRRFSHRAVRAAAGKDAHRRRLHDSHRQRPV